MNTAPDEWSIGSLHLVGHGHLVSGKPLLSEEGEEFGQVPAPVSTVGQVIHQDTVCDQRLGLVKAEPEEKLLGLIVRVLEVGDGDGEEAAFLTLSSRVAVSCLGARVNEPT